MTKPTPIEDWEGSISKQEQGLVSLLNWTVSTKALDTLELPFDFLVANESKLVEAFGGKWYGLLLARSLQGTVWFDVPALEIIPTNFTDKVSGQWNPEMADILEKLDDISCYWNEDESFRQAITLAIGHIGYYQWEIRFNSLFERFKITNNAGGWYEISIEQLREYFQKQTDEGLHFDEEQEKYLLGVYERFKSSKFLAIRSSATTEDGQESSNAWVFYSWFCQKNFKLFLNEVKKVLLSTKSGQEGTRMGIVVMDVPGSYQQGAEVWLDTEELTGNRKAKNTYRDTELYYPDWGGVIMTSNPYDDSVSEIYWVKGLPTTATGKLAFGVKVVLGKNSSEQRLSVIWVENTPGNAVAYKQVAIAWLDKFNETGELENFHNTRGEKLDSKKYGKIGYDNQVPFDERTYLRLLQLSKLLEKAFGYALDVEFVVNDEKIYVIQIRKLNGVRKRPENMSEPDLKWKKIILDPADVVSSFWFVNNETGTMLYGANGHWQVMFKTGREEEVFHILSSMEKKARKPYFAHLANLQDFPVVRGSDFPKLRWIVVSGDYGKWLWTHVIMRIIESGIPMVFVEAWMFERETIKDVTVYIDGSNKAAIYKSE